MLGLQVDWLNVLFFYTVFSLVEKLASMVGWLAGGVGHSVPLNAAGLEAASGKAFLR